MRKRTIKKAIPSMLKTRKVVVSAKVIKPTIIKDREIIIDIVNEYKRTPNQKAMERNKAALEYLNKMRG